MSTPWSNAVGFTYIGEFRPIRMPAPLSGSLSRLVIKQTSGPAIAASFQIFKQNEEFAADDLTQIIEIKTDTLVAGEPYEAGIHDSLDIPYVLVFAPGEPETNKRSLWVSIEIDGDPDPEETYSWEIGYTIDRLADI